MFLNIKLSCEEENGKWGRGRWEMLEMGNGGMAGRWGMGDGSVGRGVVFVYVKRKINY